MHPVRKRCPAPRSRLFQGLTGLLVSSLLCLQLPAAARADDSPWEADAHIVEAGDWLQLILPAVAGLTTIVLRDWEGSWQFAKVAAVDMATTHATKYLVGETRPDESESNSFPSGHTNSAFLGASFVHFRYGFKYALPLYAAATFVGYSRIYANRHWSDDVVAGAALAMLTSWVFTTPYKDRLQITPLMARNETYGIRVALRW